MADRRVEISLHFGESFPAFLAAATGMCKSNACYPLFSSSKWLAYGLADVLQQLPGIVNLMSVYQSPEIMPTTRKILIVDDEADICYFLSNSLTRKGFTTSFSHTLQGAEEQLAQHHPDILLLDNHLPDGRGVDFAHKVSQQYPGLKIIMITAHDSPQDRARAYNNGVSLFLSKPFTITEISKAVDLLTGSD